MSGVTLVWTVICEGKPEIIVGEDLLAALFVLRALRDDGYKVKLGCQFARVIPKDILP